MEIGNSYRRLLVQAAQHSSHASLKDFLEKEIRRCDTEARLIDLEIQGAGRRGPVDVVINIADDTPVKNWDWQEWQSKVEKFFALDLGTGPKIKVWVYIYHEVAQYGD